LKILTFFVISLLKLLIFFTNKAKIDNNRYGSIDFKAKCDYTMHGIGGYFDSHLYKDIDISKKILWVHVPTMQKILKKPKIKKFSVQLAFKLESFRFENKNKVICIFKIMYIIFSCSVQVVIT
jgi:hypothetical protein